MAIVINGSGTVTGLAVGGLPDGTVDAGTLATDSVTAAKLEASAITGADLPAGSVLQRQVSADTGGYTTTTSTSFVQIGSWSISNVLSGSSVQIEAHISALIEGNLVGKFAIFKGSTELARGIHQSNSVYASNAWVQPLPTIVAVDSSPSVGTNSYTLKMASSNGSIYYNYNHGTGTAPSFFVTTEIAG